MGPPSLMVGEVVATTTDRHGRGTTDYADIAHEDTGHRDTADGAEDGTADGDTAARVPSPRRGDGQDWRVMLRKGPDGSLWLGVDGADLSQVTARISAVRDALTRPQRPR